MAKHSCSSLILSALLLFSSCQEREPEPVTQYTVPASVQPYVDKFISEASQRGIELPTDNLIVELMSPVQSGSRFVCGSTWGTILGDEQNLIRIDTACLAWRNGGTEREILVIHELGHAWLERFHEDGRFPSGDWKSLMTGQEWSLGEFYVNDGDKEAYYFDELFDPSTPAPDWAE